jgi:DNA-binding MarR family transcriptional regulator
MLRRLETCGLVERRQDSEDARSFRVYLTDEGRSLEGSVTRCWEEVEEKAFAGMSVGKRMNLHRLLTKVRAKGEGQPGPDFHCGEISDIFKTIYFGRRAWILRKDV